MVERSVLQLARLEMDRKGSKCEYGTRLIRVLCANRFEYPLLPNLDDGWTGARLRNPPMSIRDE